MKTLLGIVASPRKHGNSELLVKEVFRNLADEWQLELLPLPALDLRPCRACYQCLFGDMKCPLEDDFPLALAALLRADAYVVAAPAYFLGANASLKRFLDRGLGFYAHVDELWGKPAVGAAIAGIAGMEGYTKLAVESFIKLILADLRASAVLYGALPGEIFLTGTATEVARSLAAALLQEKPERSPAVPLCPLCGGDTFRFLGEGRARCMLCSSEGNYVEQDGTLHFHMVPNAHDFFLTYASVQRHAGWLRGMKEMFLAKRQELKRIKRPYTGLGTRLLPHDVD
jgi:multimeric flavodoxin WrbA